MSAPQRGPRRSGEASRAGSPSRRVPLFKSGTGGSGPRREARGRSSLARHAAGEVHRPDAPPVALAGVAAQASGWRKAHPGPAPVALNRWVEWERAWARWMHGASAYPWVVLVLVAVSWLGDGILWCGLILSVPWWGGPRGMACAAHMFALFLVNLHIYKVLKRRTARPRPFVACPGIRACARSLDEFSFPSGHTLHAVAFSAVLGAYYPALAGPFWTFTLLVAASRVVLGLHYPSDVAIGAALGGSTAWLSLRLVS